MVSLVVVVAMIAVVVLVVSANVANRKLSLRVCCTNYAKRFRIQDPGYSVGGGYRAPCRQNSV